MRKQERDLSLLHSSIPALTCHRRVQLFALQTMSGICLRSPWEGRGGSSSSWCSQFPHVVPGRVASQARQPAPPAPHCPLVSEHPLESPLVLRVITQTP